MARGQFGPDDGALTQMALVMNQGKMVPDSGDFGGVAEGESKRSMLRTGWSGGGRRGHRQPRMDFVFRPVRPIQRTKFKAARVAAETLLNLAIKASSGTYCRKSTPAWRSRRSCKFQRAVELDEK